MGLKFLFFYLFFIYMFCYSFLPQLRINFGIFRRKILTRRLFNHVIVNWDTFSNYEKVQENRTYDQLYDKKIHVAHYIELGSPAEKNI